MKTGTWKLRESCIVKRATTVEEAEMSLEAFAGKWDSELPTISKSWRLNWERVIPFLSYPEEIRRVIYTTNAIESVNVHHMFLHIVLGMEP